MNWRQSHGCKHTLNTSLSIHSYIIRQLGSLYWNGIKCALHSLQATVIRGKNMVALTTLLPLLISIMIVSAGVSSRQKNQFLRLHNRARLSVPDAANMLEMTWDRRLASSAQDYADNCRFSHSTNRYRQNTSSAPWSWIGENIYLTSSVNPKNIVSRALSHWVSEKSHYNRDTDYCDDGEECGHYKQVCEDNPPIISDKSE